MKRAIRFKQIIWGDRFMLTHDEKGQDIPVYPDADGAVEYEQIRTSSPEDHPGKKVVTEQEYDKMTMEEKKSVAAISPYSSPIFQPFSRKGTYKQDKAGYVWAWNGNQEAPTLTPSFLMDEGMRDGKQLARIHLYFTNGKINLVGDSNVELVQ